VALTGDSISFNNIYRDRDEAWNIQDLPVPLVFFCHANPVDWPGVENSTQPPPFASATDDVLLNADIVRIVLEAAYPAAAGADQRRSLLADSAALAEQLHAHQPPFFRHDGNRVGGSGEYVVCLRPVFQGERVLPTATVQVFSRRPPGSSEPRWQQASKTLQINYETRSGEGGPAHAGF
jgi:hypothetical protein